MTRTCTLKGNPLDLAGAEVKVGQTAPDATLKKDLATAVKLSELGSNPKILSVVPSLDTPVCAEQTKRFNEQAAYLPHVDFITISCDLPPAQARFCGAESINTERIQVLSDHQDLNFGTTYGTLIPHLRIQCRAVFVIGSDNIIKYAEYVPEVADHPDYGAALDCAKAQ